MIKDFLEKYRQPKFREKQFHLAFYQQLIGSWDELTGWPKDLREKLNQEVPFSTITIVKQQISKTKDTIKALFQINDTQFKIETVLMRHESRNTLCVSCMVGCPVGCSFCATGKMGFKLNLSVQNIIDQILHFNRILRQEDQRVDNIVFMGMGEPLLNFDNLIQSIEVITHPEKIALSIRRIAISTSGYIHQLEKLIDSGYKGRLALSLHAPNQKLREQIMSSVAKANPLPELLNTIDRFIENTNRRVSMEYILINEVNDQAIHAKELVNLFRGKLIHFNLIPYNPILGTTYQKSEKKAIYRFDQILKDGGIPSSIRVTMGDDIDAACGQLATGDKN